MSAVRQGIASMMMPMMRLAGRAYIAGPELQDALKVAERLADNGYASSIAFWDALETTPAEVLEAYIAGVRALQSSSLDGYVSVKAPSLQFDRGSFSELIGECAKGNTRLHFDSLGSETVDPTKELISELLPKFRNITITLPGCWSRSLRDADWAVEHGMAVRVVKGQWPDPGEGAVNSISGYLRVIDRLAGRASHVAVATHNPMLATESLRKLLKANTPCELELLFGLPVERVLPVARELRVPVRLYIPYGYGWLPYSLSQARRNPRIFWWMLKDMVLRNQKSGIYSR
jgi:proline dehydrogenase